MIAVFIVSPGKIRSLHKGEMPPRGFISGTFWKLHFMASSRRFRLMETNQ
jgi:hypothetical protein